MQTFKSLMEGKNIEHILRKEFPEVRFNCEENDTSFILQILVVQFKRRNQGEGSSFMKRLVELAKQLKKNVALTPDASYSTEEDMNAKQLTKWYESFGFKKQKYKEHTHSIINNSK